METLRICRQCQRELPAGAPGELCPECRKTPTIFVPLPASSTTGRVPAPTREEIAAIFPQLEIIELAGQGGMGMVYKARQPKLDRFVGIKILSPELSGEPAFADRFEREAKALGRLSHSSIISIYDSGSAGPYYFFLMEFVEGVNLHSLIEDKQLTAADSLRIASEICDALQYAHDEGVVHRDIKPQNILIDKRGRVKIADFGLAKLTLQSGAGATARTTMVMGTPHYMAPEQVERPLEVDHRADIYSLGVVIYQMLTGELPIGRFAPPSARAAVDSRLDAVILRALEKEPRLRYQQARQIRTEIDTVRNPAPMTPATTTAASPVNRRAVLVRQTAIIAATALLAVLGYKFYAARHGRDAVEVVAAAPEVFARGPGGIVFTERAISTLHLAPAKTREANQIIRRADKQFIELEQRHIENFTDAVGHVHLTIKPFAPQMRVITDSMWQQLEGILDAGQVAAAHNLHMERLFGNGGKSTVSIELWKESGQYHFVESWDGAGDLSKATSRASSGPAIRVIPPRYRSYLKEEPKTQKP